MIRNFGLFWRRDGVFWGRPRVRGNLLGRLSGNLKRSPVDFRDQQGVYVLYDDGPTLVYVGQTGRGEDRLFKRLRGHTSDHLATRWTKFSWFGIRPVNSTGELRAPKKEAKEGIATVLNQIEAVLISAAEPPLNKQGGSFGARVEQYLQHRDEKPDRLGPNVEEMIRAIYEQVQSPAPKSSGG